MSSSTEVQPLLHYQQQSQQSHSHSSNNNNTDEQHQPNYTDIQSWKLYTLIIYALIASLLLIGIIIHSVMESNNNNTSTNDANNSNNNPLTNNIPTSIPIVSTTISPSISSSSSSVDNNNNNNLHSHSHHSHHTINTAAISASAALSLLSGPRFAVLSDLHLEPNYDPNNKILSMNICRDSTAVSECIKPDWQYNNDSNTNSNNNNPFIYGRINCDPPELFLIESLNSLYQLLVETAATAVDSIAPLDFILLPGDLAAHFINCKSTHTATINRMIDILINTFPNITILPAIGNTDLYPTYYLPLPDEEQLLPITSEIVQPHQQCKSEFNELLIAYQSLIRFNRNEQHSFCHGGYYSRLITNSNIKIIVLNSIIWSSSYSNINSNSNSNSNNKPLDCNSSLRPIDPYGQFSWLLNQLQSALELNQLIYIMSHLPFGSKDNSNTAGAYCEQYSIQLLSIIKQYSTIIRAQFYGDFNEDLMRLITNTDSNKIESISFIHSGLSMRKHNNPAVRIYEYQPDTGDLIDYIQFYAPIQKLNQLQSDRFEWEFHYRFKQQYQLDSDQYITNTRTLQQLSQLLLTNPAVIDQYSKSITINNNNGDYIDQQCDLLVFDLIDNLECKRTGNIDYYYHSKNNKHSSKKHHKNKEL